MILGYAGYVALLCFGIAYKLNLRGDWIFLPVAIMMFVLQLIINRKQRRTLNQGSKNAK